MSDKDKKEKPKYIYEVGPNGMLILGVARTPNVILEIPPKLYSLNTHPDYGYVLKPEEDFKMPTKIYGAVDSNIDRFFKSFEAEDRNLGVMLLGASGSGKTLTLKQIVQRANQMGYPAILVNDSFGGDSFVNYLNAIIQNAVFCFDELDKTYVARSDSHGGTYQSKAQDTILRILDGASSGNKKMFVFTANDQTQLSPYLFNRPSRIRYRVSYELTPSAVIEYLNAHLKDKTEVNIRAFIHLLRMRVVQYSTSVPHLNFDMMVELVKEMNRFGEDLDHAYRAMFSNKENFCVYFEINRYKDGTLLEQDIPALCNVEANSPIRFDVSKDAIKISADITRELTEEEKEADTKLPQYARRGVNNKVPLLLSSDNFTSFGDNYDTLHFDKDGFQYVVKYSDMATYNWLTSRINRNRGGGDEWDHGGPFGGRGKNYHRPE